MRSCGYKFHQLVVLHDRIKANRTSVTHDLVDHVANGLRHVGGRPWIYFKVFDGELAIVVTGAAGPGHFSLSGANASQMR